MKKVIEPFVHIIIWMSLSLFLLHSANTLGLFHKDDDTILIPFTIGTLLNVFLFYGVSFFIIPRFSISKKVSTLINHLLLLFIGLTILESVIDFFFFTAIYSTEIEPFGSQVVYNFVSNALILSLALSYGFVKSWIRNERLKQVLKEERLSAELNFLKAQINPHFLFNVLNMAFSSASGSGDKTTASIIEKLSGLMRYMLYESNAEKVEVEKEISYLTNYIGLQKLRLSKDIPVIIDFKTSGDLINNSIAPLILIPFVENAFKYGIKLERESNISISLEIQEKKLQFSVENSKFEPDTSKNKNESGVGLENVKKRLVLLYPERHSLNIDNGPDYFKVDLKIYL